MKILSYAMILLQQLRTVGFLQFIRFGLVGIVATLCHMGTLILDSMYNWIGNKYNHYAGNKNLISNQFTSIIYYCCFITIYFNAACPF